MALWHLERGGRFMVPGPMVDLNWVTFDPPLIYMALMRDISSFGRAQG